MENNIGVGIIVGIAVASSSYVWYSNDFTKNQKYLLLLFILFPPLQWISILIILIYNSTINKNSTEKINERKLNQVKTNLDSSINNLAELKNKGILTDLEYYEKVAKIKTDKAQQDIQNLPEYKQLKSLFDNGILTKEEFENKIKLVKIDSKLIENNFIITAQNNFVIKKEELRPNKKTSTSTYIYAIIGYIIFIIILYLIE